MDLLEQRLSRQASRTARIGLACVSSLWLLFLATGCARFGRPQFPPETTAANFDRHALANPGLKQFMEQQLRKPLEEWPLHEWDYPRLTLAAWYFQPQFQADVIDGVERSAAVYRVTEKEVPGIDALIAAILRQYALTKEHVESGIAEPHELLLARLQVMAAGFAKLEAQVKLQNALGSLEDAAQLPVESIGYAAPFRNPPR